MCIGIRVLLKESRCRYLSAGLAHHHHGQDHAADDHGKHHLEILPVSY